jgi:hypothetical protein
MTEVADDVSFPGNPQAHALCRAVTIFPCGRSMHMRSDPPRTQGSATSLSPARGTAFPTISIVLRETACSLGFPRGRPRAMGLDPPMVRLRQSSMGTGERRRIGFSISKITEGQGIKSKPLRDAGGAEALEPPRNLGRWRERISQTTSHALGSGNPDAGRHRRSPFPRDQRARSLSAEKRFARACRRFIPDAPGHPANSRRLRQPPTFSLNKRRQVARPAEWLPRLRVATSLPMSVTGHAPPNP